LKKLQKRSQFLLYFQRERQPIILSERPQCVHEKLHHKYQNHGNHLRDARVDILTGEQHDDEGRHGHAMHRHGEKSRRVFPRRICFAKIIFSIEQEGDRRAGADPKHICDVRVPADKKHDEKDRIISQVCAGARSPCKI